MWTAETLVRHTATLLVVSFSYYDMLSADNLCKQFGPRSGLTERFKPLHTLIVFLKEFSKRFFLKKVSR